MDSDKDVVDSTEQASISEDRAASSLKSGVVTDFGEQPAEDEVVPADTTAEGQSTDEKPSPPQGDTQVNLPDVSTEGTAAVPGDGLSESQSDGSAEVEEKTKPSVENDKAIEQPEIIQVPETTDDNLPSFDEWKQKMLAEQAEQEKTKSQEGQCV